MEYNQYPEIKDDKGKVVWTAKPKMLKKGEKVQYELYGLRNSPLDRTGATIEMPFVYGIQNKDRIFVPIPKKYEEEFGEEGVYVETAFIEKFLNNGEPVFGNIFFKKENAAVLTVTGGRAVEQSLYEFLETNNYNASNPNRDTSKKKVFAKIDRKARAEENRKARRERKEAVDKAENLGMNELMRVATALGYFDQTSDEDTLRDRVEIYAENNADDFLNMLENTDTLIQYHAVQAMKAGFIKVDMQQRKITSSTGESLHTWSPAKDVNWTEKFVEFVKSEEGVQFYNGIKDDLKVKEVKNKK